MFSEQTANVIEQMGCNINEVSHAVGELSKAMGGYSHAEGYGSLSRSPVRPSTIICVSIVRKPGLKVDGIKNATLTINSEKIDWDVLEKRLGVIEQRG